MLEELSQTEQSNFPTPYTNQTQIQGTIFVLKAVYFVACDFLDLLGLRKAGVVKKRSNIFKTLI